MDYHGDCLDEISLEGLDGITIPALWTRLENRKPKFGLLLDEKCKSYLWSHIIAPDEDLQFYALPTPRPDLVLFNRFDYPDKETGIILEQPDQPEDIYPVNIISDKTGILGSCTDYKQRVDITDDIRDEAGMVKMSLAEATEKYGNKLVIVGSQELRTKTLMGPENNYGLQLTEKHFCFLERIGRSRYHGETTQGKNSLQVFKENPKTMFYIRAMLMKYSLVTSQSFNMRLTKGQNIAGKLLHLPRFFVERKPMYLGWLETLTNVLDKKPNKRELLPIVRAELGLKDATFKKLYQLGQKYVKTELLPYKELYPDSSPSDYMCKNKKKEKFVRVVTLVKKFKYQNGMGMDDDEDDDEMRDPDAILNGTSAEGEVYERRYLILERPVLQQVYSYIESLGGQGASQVRVCNVFGVGKLDARLFCRNLERHGLVKKIMCDFGKQRVQRYVAVKHMHDSDILEKMQAEKEKNKKLKQRADTSKDLASDLGSGGEGTESQDDEDDDVMHMFADKHSEHFQNQKKGNAHVTYRMMKRANMVIEAVKQAKLIDNIYYIQKKIMDEEEKEGFSYKLDKKSLLRLIDRLAKENQLKSIRTTITVSDVEKKLHFVCDPSVSIKDQLVQSAIEQARHKEMAISKEVTREMMKESRGEGQVGEIPNNPSRPNYGLLKSRLKAADMEYDQEAGRRYGYVPRMKRIQVVHELLWYLLYGYGQPIDNVGSGILQNESEMPMQESATDRDGENGDNENGDQSKPINLKVYCDELSWRRFLPPLPKHSGYKDGWCLIGDVLLVLPLSIFCQIIRINFKIKGLEEYLRDPILRYVTVSQLPTAMRQQLMFERKYIFTFSDVCTYLCQMGLLSFGKREWKEKEQIFIYLHKNVGVLDTTVMDDDETVEERQEKFTLTAFTDINHYWFRLQWICLNTPLDYVKDPNKDGKALGKTTLKPQRFHECLQGKDPEEIQDGYNLPGDHQGAGGLDSLFWSHLRRNWSWNYNLDMKIESMMDSGNRGSEKRATRTPITTTDDVQETPNQKFPGTTPSKGKSKKISKSSAKSSEKNKENTSKHTIIMTSAKPNKGGKGVKRPPRETTKTSCPSPKKPKLDKKGETGYKKGYDDKDREALSKMSRERVDWSLPEDSLLLLCQVTATFLAGERRDMFIKWHDIRDIMHMYFQSSVDKTSKACQRRLKYMLKNPETLRNVNMFVGEALQDQALVAEFKTGKKYIKTNSEENITTFLACLKKMKEKFKNSFEEEAIELPNTIEEIEEQFDIQTQETNKGACSFSDTDSDKDIYFSVLHNLIHSAMLLSDKQGRAHELYQLFNQYPEDLLLAVFSTMKNDGLITKIKTNEKRRQLQWSSVPGSASMGSYQVAQRYMYHWYSRYPKSIFENSCEVLKQLDDSAEDEVVSLPMEDSGGFAAMLVSLMASKKVKFETVIPERIIVVESKGAKVTEPKSRRKKKVLQTESDEEEEALIAEAEKNRPKDAQVQTQENPGDPEPGTLPMGSQVSFSRASHSTLASRAMLSIARGQYINSQINVRSLEPTENIVVNSCSVNVTLKPEYRYQPPSVLSWPFVFEAFDCLKTWNHASTWLHPKSNHFLLKNLRALQPAKLNPQTVITTCRDSKGLLDEEVVCIEYIYQYVKTYGSRGATADNLVMQFKDDAHFRKCLKVALELRLVLQVGVTVLRYVSWENVRPWLIHAYKNVKGRHTGLTIEAIEQEPDDLIELGHDLPAYLPGSSTQSTNNEPKGTPTKGQPKPSKSPSPATSVKKVNVSHGVAPCTMGLDPEPQPLVKPKPITAPNVTESNVVVVASGSSDSDKVQSEHNIDTSSSVVLSEEPMSQQSDITHESLVQELDKLSKDQESIVQQLDLPSTAVAPISQSTTQSSDNYIRVESNESEWSCEPIVVDTDGDAVVNIPCPSKLAKSPVQTVTEFQESSVSESQNENVHDSLSQNLSGRTVLEKEDILIQAPVSSPTIESCKKQLFQETDGMDAEPIVETQETQESTVVVDHTLVTAIKGSDVSSGVEAPESGDSTEQSTITVDKSAFATWLMKRITQIKSPAKHNLTNDSPSKQAPKDDLSLTLASDEVSLQDHTPKQTHSPSSPKKDTNRYTSSVSSTPKPTSNNTTSASPTITQTLDSLSIAVPEMTEEDSHVEMQSPDEPTQQTPKQSQQTTTQSSDEPTQQTSTQSSDEPTQQTSTQSSDERTQQTPTQSLDELTQQTPTQSSDEPTQLTPKQSSNELTQQTSTQSSDEPTQQTPKQSSDELTQQTSTQSSDEPTQQTPTQSLDEPTQLTPKQSSQEPTQLTPKQVSDEPTRPTPTQVSDETTQLTPKQVSDKPTELTPKQFSDEPTQPTSKQVSEEPTQLTAKQAPEEPTQLTPKQVLGKPTQLTPKEVSDEPTQPAPKQVLNKPTQLTPKHSSDELAQLVLKQSSDEPTQFARNQAPGKPTDLTPKQISNEITQLTPQQSSEEPTQLTAKQAPEEPAQLTPKQAPKEPTELPPKQLSEELTQLDQKVCKESRGDQPGSVLSSVPKTCSTLDEIITLSVKSPRRQKVTPVKKRSLKDNNTESSKRIRTSVFDIPSPEKTSVTNNNFEFKYPDFIPPKRLRTESIRSEGFLVHDEDFEDDIIEKQNNNASKSYTYCIDDSSDENEDYEIKLNHKKGGDFTFSLDVIDFDDDIEEEERQRKKRQAEYAYCLDVIDLDSGSSSESDDGGRDDIMLTDACSLELLRQDEDSDDEPEILEEMARMKSREKMEQEKLKNRERLEQSLQQNAKALLHGPYSSGAPPLPMMPGKLRMPNHYGTVPNQLSPRTMITPSGVRIRLPRKSVSEANFTLYQSPVKVECSSEESSIQSTANAFTTSGYLPVKCEDIKRRESMDENVNYPTSSTPHNETKPNIQALPMSNLSPTTVTSSPTTLARTRIGSITELSTAVTCSTAHTSPVISSTVLPSATCSYQSSSRPSSPRTEIPVPPISVVSTISVGSSLSELNVSVTSSILHSEVTQNSISTQSIVESKPVSSLFAATTTTTSVLSKPQTTPNIQTDTTNHESSKHVVKTSVSISQSTETTHKDIGVQSDDFQDYLRQCGYLQSDSKSDERNNSSRDEKSNPVVQVIDNGSLMLTKQAPSKKVQYKPNVENTAGSPKTTLTKDVFESGQASPSSCSSPLLNTSPNRGKLKMLEAENKGAPGSDKGIWIPRGTIVGITPLPPDHRQEAVVPQSDPITVTSKISVTSAGVSAIKSQTVNVSPNKVVSVPLKSLTNSPLFIPDPIYTKKLHMGAWPKTYEKLVEALLKEKPEMKETNDKSGDIPVMMTDSTKEDPLTNSKGSFGHQDQSLDQSKTVIEQSAAAIKDSNMGDNSARDTANGNIECFQSNVNHSSESIRSFSEQELLTHQAIPETVTARVQLSDINIPQSIAPKLDVPEEKYGRIIVKKTPKVTSTSILSTENVSPPATTLPVTVSARVRDFLQSKMKSAGTSFAPTKNKTLVNVSAITSTVTVNPAPSVPFTIRPSDITAKPSNTMAKAIHLVPESFNLKVPGTIMPHNSRNVHSTTEPTLSIDQDPGISPADKTKNKWTVRRNAHGMTFKKSQESSQNKKIIGKQRIYIAKANSKSRNLSGDVGAITEKQRDTKLSQPSRKLQVVPDTLAKILESAGLKTTVLKVSGSKAQVSAALASTIKQTPIVTKDIVPTFEPESENEDFNLSTCMRGSENDVLKNIGKDRSEIRLHPDTGQYCAQKSIVSESHPVNVPSICSERHATGIVTHGELSNISSAASINNSSSVTIPQTSANLYTPDNTEIEQQHMVPTSTVDTSHQQILKSDVGSKQPELFPLIPKIQISETVATKHISTVLQSDSTRSSSSFLPALTKPLEMLPGVEIFSHNRSIVCNHNTLTSQTVIDNTHQTMSPYSPNVRISSQPQTVTFPNQAPQTSLFWNPSSGTSQQRTSSLSDSRTTLFTDQWPRVQTLNVHESCAINTDNTTPDSNQKICDMQTTVRIPRQISVSGETFNLVTSNNHLQSSSIVPTHGEASIASSTVQSDTRENVLNLPKALSVVKESSEIGHSLSDPSVSQTQPISMMSIDPESNVQFAVPNALMNEVKYILTDSFTDNPSSLDVAATKQLSQAKTKTKAGGKSHGKKSWKATGKPLGRPKGKGRPLNPNPVGTSVVHKITNLSHKGIEEHLQGIFSSKIGDVNRPVIRLQLPEGLELNIPQLQNQLNQNFAQKMKENNQQHTHQRDDNDTDRATQGVIMEDTIDRVMDTKRYTHLKSMLGDSVKERTKVVNPIYHTKEQVGPAGYTYTSKHIDRAPGTSYTVSQDDIKPEEMHQIEQRATCHSENIINSNVHRQSINTQGTSSSFIDIKPCSYYPDIVQTSQRNAPAVVSIEDTDKDENIGDSPAYVPEVNSQPVIYSADDIPVYSELKIDVQDTEYIDSNPSVEQQTVVPSNTGDAGQIYYHYVGQASQVDGTCDSSSEESSDDEYWPNEDALPPRRADSEEEGDLREPCSDEGSDDQNWIKMETPEEEGEIENESSSSALLKQPSSGTMVFDLRSFGPTTSQTDASLKTTVLDLRGIVSGAAGSLESDDDSSDNCELGSHNIASDTIVAKTVVDDSDMEQSDEDEVDLLSEKDLSPNMPEARSDKVKETRHDYEEDERWQKILENTPRKATICKIKVEPTVPNKPESKSSSLDVTDVSEVDERWKKVIEGTTRKTANVSEADERWDKIIRSTALKDTGVRDKNRENELTNSDKLEAKSFRLDVSDVSEADERWNKIFRKSPPKETCVNVKVEDTYKTNTEVSQDFCDSDSDGDGLVQLIKREADMNPSDEAGAEIESSDEDEIEKNVNAKPASNINVPVEAGFQDNFPSEIVPEMKSTGESEHEMNCISSESDVEEDSESDSEENESQDSTEMEKIIYPRIRTSNESNTPQKSDLNESDKKEGDEDKKGASGVKFVLSKGQFTRIGGSGNTVLPKSASPMLSKFLKESSQRFSSNKQLSTTNLVSNKSARTSNKNEQIFKTTLLETNEQIEISYNTDITDYELLEASSSRRFPKWDLMKRKGKDVPKEVVKALDLPKPGRPPSRLPEGTALFTKLPNLTLDEAQDHIKVVFSGQIRGMSTSTIRVELPAGYKLEVSDSLDVRLCTCEDFVVQSSDNSILTVNNGDSVTPFSIPMQYKRAAEVSEMPLDALTTIIKKLYLFDSRSVQRRFMYQKGWALPSLTMILSAQFGGLFSIMFKVDCSDVNLTEGNETKTNPDETSTTSSSEPSKNTRSSESSVVAAAIKNLRAKLKSANNRMPDLSLNEIFRFGNDISSKHKLKDSDDVADPLSHSILESQLQLLKQLKEKGMLEEEPPARKHHRPTILQRKRTAQPSASRNIADLLRAPMSKTPKTTFSADVYSFSGDEDSPSPQENYDDEEYVAHVKEKEAAVLESVRTGKGISSLELTRVTTPLDYTRYRTPRTQLTIPKQMPSEKDSNASKSDMPCRFPPMHAGLTHPTHFFEKIANTSKNIVKRNKANASASNPSALDQPETGSNAPPTQVIQIHNFTQNNYNLPMDEIMRMGSQVQLQLPFSGITTSQSETRQHSKQKRKETHTIRTDEIIDLIDEESEEYESEDEDIVLPPSSLALNSRGMIEIKPDEPFIEYERDVQASCSSRASSQSGDNVLKQITDYSPSVHTEMDEATDNSQTGDIQLQNVDETNMFEETEYSRSSGQISNQADEMSEAVDSPLRHNTQTNSPVETLSDPFLTVDTEPGTVDSSIENSKITDYGNQQNDTASHPRPSDVFVLSSDDEYVLHPTTDSNNGTSPKSKNSNLFEKHSVDVVDVVDVVEVVEDCREVVEVIEHVEEHDKIPDRSDFQPGKTFSVIFPSVDLTHTESDSESEVTQLDGTADEKPAKDKKSKKSSPETRITRSRRRSENHIESEAEDKSPKTKRKRDVGHADISDKIKSNEPISQCDTTPEKPRSIEEETPCKERSNIQVSDRTESHTCVATDKSEPPVHNLRSSSRRRKAPVLPDEIPETTAASSGTYQRVRLVPRPWKTPEGTINRPTLRMMLEAVLMQIMSKPGISWTSLKTKYSPLLQPVPLAELLEMLEQLGCVRRKRVVQRSKPSLFSSRVTFSTDTSEDGEKLDFYLPTVDCVLKMGQFELLLKAPSNNHNT